MITKNINSTSGKKYEEITVPGIVYDDEPIEGSFNGITSDAVAKATSGGSGGTPVKDLIPEGASEENKLATAADVAGVQEDVDTIEGKIPSDTSTTNKLVNESGLQDAIDNASESWSTGFTPKGESSVSDLNGLTTQSNGDSYIVTDSGTLTDGSLAVVAGDQVAWDATNSVWYRINPSGFKIVSIPGYLYAVVDASDKFLFGVKVDGSIDWQKGIPEPLRALRYIIAGSSQYFLSYETDNNGRLLSTLKNDGTRTFITPVKFEGGIKWTKKNLEELLAASSENGVLGQGDWSCRSSLEIPKPSCAVVNFTNIANMPTTKTSDMHAIMQFWDMQGNYFMKKVIANAQGNSSMLYPKKNLSIDICNDDWAGDDTFSLKIGDWVAQDSFHLKAYYTDYLRGRGAIGYELFNEVQKTRGIVDVEWKNALIDQNDVFPGKGQNFASIGKTDLQLDTGARNHPLAFPCIVYLNGEFYGIFSWQLKKHRDNYHMKKDVPTHVHLDGTLGAGFFGGTIDWTLFEVRNPKGLKDVDGNKYDGDNPKELSDTDPLSSEVKSYIVGLSQYVSELESVKSTYGIDSDEFEAAFEARFDVDNFIDYLIFSDITGNYDGFSKNWQWLTYDGVKWYIGVYDLDGIFGSEFHGESLIAPYSTHVDTTNGLPTNYIFANANYQARLETRYAELRKSVLTYDNIVAKIQAWTNAVGIDNYKLEYDAKHWKNSPCNRDAEVDEHWELVLGADGKPIMGDSSTYNSGTTYAVDNEVYYGQNANMGYYKFKCKAETTGNAPISHFYFKENIYSIASWVKAEIENMDALYNYSN